MLYIYIHWLSACLVCTIYDTQTWALLKSSHGWTDNYMESCGVLYDMNNIENDKINQLIHNITKIKDVTEIVTELN